MQQEQLALFGDDEVVGTGQPHPWPVAEPAIEAEEPTPDPNQMALDEIEDAA